MGSREKSRRPLLLDRILDSIDRRPPHHHRVSGAPENVKILSSAQCADTALNALSGCVDVAALVFTAFGGDDRCGAP